MKKLIAMLIACAAITCTFASCGSDEDDSSETKASSVTETSDESSEETSDEDEKSEDAADESETEEETTEEETTEEETTEEETTEEEEEEETTEKKVSAERTTEGDIVGSWLSNDDEIYGFAFYADGSGSIIVDASEMMYFTADGEMYLSGIILTSDYIEFDGKTLSVSEDGESLISLERNGSPDDSTFDGVYTMTGGAFYDLVVDSLGAEFEIDNSELSKIYTTIDGENLYIEFPELFTYDAVDGDLLLTGSIDALGIEDGSAISYAFEGDDLVLINSDNDEIVLSRIG